MKTRTYLRVKPKLSFRLLGVHSITLTAGKTYKAIPATNQPENIMRGKVFVDGDHSRPGDSMLLEMEDYTLA